MSRVANKVSFVADTRVSRHKTEMRICYNVATKLISMRSTTRANVYRTQSALRYNSGDTALAENLINHLTVL